MNELTFDNLKFFLKAAEKPFFFGKEAVARRRFSSSVFNYGFDVRDSYFYVFVDVEEKRFLRFFLSAYIFPFLRASRVLLFCGSMRYLLFGSYSFFNLFSNCYSGYFPVVFFNNIFFRGGLSRFSYFFSTYSYGYNTFKPRIHDLFFDIDMHISCFFGK